MYIRPLFTLLIYIVALSAAAQQRDTVKVSDFGILPNSYNNQSGRIRQAITECKRQGAKVLVFDKGRYDFYPEDAVRRDYFITNTSTEQECPSKTKTFGLYFEDVKNLTIEGNDATLMFHGKMTMVAFAHCENIKMQNIHFDFERPGGSEMVYTCVDEHGVEVQLHRDSRYDIADGRLQLVGEGWRTDKPHCIEYNPKTEHMVCSSGWQTLASASASEVAPGRIRFSTPADFRPQVGNRLTVRDIIRDQVGMFIYESRGVIFSHVEVRYMHGLGIVSQYSKDITMSHVDCLPREYSGRILASSADFMHFSGCSGKINIHDCRYSGAQDDCINVHGTNLRAVERVSDTVLVLRFMHGQSYGYHAYFVGDTVAFVNPSTMLRYASATVVAVRRLTDRTVEVTFDRTLPRQLEIGSDCVENMTCTPEVEIRRCKFAHTSTRGVLVTTPRKVIIADNWFQKLGMSAILIEGDAAGWFESGPVCDVTIENNTFYDCAYQGGPSKAFIAMNPSNAIVDSRRPVHTGIRIIGNSFFSEGNPIIYAKSTGNLSFTGNSITITEKKPEKELYLFEGCSNVKLKNNSVKQGFYDSSCLVDKPTALENRQ